MDDCMLHADQAPEVANSSVPPESVTPQNEAVVAMAAHLGIDPVPGASWPFHDLNLCSGQSRHIIIDSPLVTMGDPQWELLPLIERSYPNAACR